MKRYYFKSILIVFSSLAMLFSCKDKEEPSSCCDREYTDTTFIVNGEERHLRVYSSMTPNNYPFYDEIGGDSSGIFRGKPIVLLNNSQDTTETGRANIDSIYNDKVNEYFYVKGIEAFPYNEIYFYTQGDTTPILDAPYKNYKNDKSTIFDGRAIEKLLRINKYGIADTVFLPKYIKSGSYRFKIILFEDLRHTMPIDTFEGPFCIIRTPKYNFNEQCAGWQSSNTDRTDSVLTRQY